MHAPRWMFGLFAAMLAGCSIFPRPDGPAVNYFDIRPGTPPATSAVTAKVMALPFQAGGIYGSRMVFKLHANQVKLDEFNRWVAPPDEMVRLILTAGFGGKPGQAGAPELTLEGEILDFSCNLTDKTVTVAIAIICREYPSQQIAWREVFVRHVRIEHETAGDFAAAAAKGVMEIAEAVAARLTVANHR